MVPFRRKKRAAAEQSVTLSIQQVGGKIVSGTVITEIGYHALIATLPRNQIQNIVNNNLDAAFLQCESVQFFRPCGQMVFGKEPFPGETETINAETKVSVPIGQPTIALFDGLPLENHALLSGRLIIDDPDDYGTDYVVVSRKHGTAMASLIVQGDLNNGQHPLRHPLYVRPIMRGQPKFSGSDSYYERIPKNVLFTDLLHRSVRRLFESENGQPPVAPNVKIINLSIGDPVRQFINAMSPAAKLIDWLSEKYKVLFVVSAGNHPIPICVNLTWQELSALSADDRESEIVKALYADRRNRRLLAPAETINGLTVGALHFDNSTPANGGFRTDLFSHTFLPSPISAFGGGYRRSIKPDLVFDGGRQFYDEPTLKNKVEKLLLSSAIVAPGNKTAYSDAQGNLRATAFSRGTSNATALISRSAGICYDSLLQLLEDQPSGIELGKSEEPLLKAMLVHGCSWRESKTRLREIFLKADDSVRKITSRWMGYGNPDIQKVIECTQQRVTVLGFGELTDEQAHLFRLPLPPSLSAQCIKRRLTVTLAWFSRIVPSTQKYRESSLWFEVLNNQIAAQRSENDWRDVKRGTVQHEIFEGENVQPVADGEFLQVKVNCRKDAGKIEGPVSYGLVVSFEVAEGQGTNIAVYDEIKTRIASVIPIQSIVGDNR